jgi:hypothetical protein
LKKASDPQPAQGGGLKALTRDSFSYAVTPTPEPNKYQITISWGKTSDLVEVSTNGQKKFSARQAAVGFSEVVDGGKTYQYSLAVFNFDKTAKDQIEYAIEVPRDYVLSGPIDLKGDSVITGNRVFITKDAMVTSYRNRIVITANEVYSDGGTIQNYPWGFADCADGNSGNPGGDISIIAKKAQGNLTIAMVGARGCFPMGPGGPGGKLNVSIENGSNLLIITQMKPSPGAEERPGMYRAGYAGAPATSCINLTKDSKNDCK